jgi:hypothetical protein
MQRKSLADATLAMSPSDSSPPATLARGVSTPDTLPSNNKGSSDDSIQSTTLAPVETSQPFARSVSNGSNNATSSNQLVPVDETKDNSSHSTLEDPTDTNKYLKELVAQREKFLQKAKARNELMKQSNNKKRELLESVVARRAVIETELTETKAKTAALQRQVKELTSNQFIVSDRSSVLYDQIHGLILDMMRRFKDIHDKPDQLNQWIQEVNIIMTKASEIFTPAPPPPLRKAQSLELNGVLSNASKRPMIADFRTLKVEAPDSLNNIISDYMSESAAEIQTE